MNYLGRIIFSQGNMLGFRDCFFIVGAIFLAALIPALMMRRRSRPATPANASGHEEDYSKTAPLPAS